MLERWADPNLLVKAGAKRLAAVIAKASNNHTGVERADEWLAAANAAIELYAGHPAVAFGDLAAEVATEVRLLRADRDRARRARRRTRDRVSLGRSRRSRAQPARPRRHRRTRARRDDG